jgi:hypothetical protein
VTGRIPCLVKAGKYNNGYLRAKQRRMSHLLDSAELLGGEGAGAGTSGAAGAGVESVMVVGEDGEMFEGELDGSFCWYDHEVRPGGRVGDWEWMMAATCGRCSSVGGSVGRTRRLMDWGVCC